MKKVLLIHFTQTQQTHLAIEELKSGLSEGYQTVTHGIQTEEPLQFPWKIKTFFRAFPKCINEEPIKIQKVPDSVLKEDFDLIVIGYPIWFLSPSLPTQALLREPEFQKLVRGKPVLCLITARNMWYSAAKKINQKLRTLGASWIQSVVLTDTGPSWATFVTTPRWLLTGKKEAFGIFPEAGISTSQYKLMESLGKAISHQPNPNPQSWGRTLFLQHSHSQNHVALLMELVGHRYFIFSGKLIAALSAGDGKWRDLLLIPFRAGLIFIILTLLPTMSLAMLLFGRQISRKLDRLLADAVEGR
jgi:hypothetical protein